MATDCSRDLLTRPILSATADYPATCCSAAIRSPVTTVDVVEIATGIVGVSFR